MAGVKDEWARAEKRGQKDSRKRAFCPCTHPQDRAGRSLGLPRAAGPG